MKKKPIFDRLLKLKEQEEHTLNMCNHNTFLST